MCLLLTIWDQIVRVAIVNGLLGADGCGASNLFGAITLRFTFAQFKTNTIMVDIFQVFGSISGRLES